MLVVAENKLYNAGHTVFSLFEFRESSSLYGEPDVITYGLYNNSCILWEGESKEEGMREFDKLTKAAW